MNIVNILTLNMNPGNKEVPCFIIILGVFAICVFVPTPLVTIDIRDIEEMGRARCSSVVRAFAHGAMGRRIDPPWCGPIEPRLV